MSKYTYRCDQCNKTIQKTVNSKDDIVLCECGKQMDRQMPRLNGPTTVNETVDKFTKPWKQDHKLLLKERHDEYYWSKVVPQLVASGDYSILTMLEQGWIWFDDNKQMHVHNKPPYRR